MRVLHISLAGLELAKAHLHRPIATIGRSPSCDVILRAAGVKPIHFLLEWLGSGPFDPSSGQWSIFDISTSSDESGEGMVLSAENDSLTFGGFQFKWIEDRLESQPELGGNIISSVLSVAPTGKASMLELVQIRTDSGAVEEVLHLRGDNLRRFRPLRRVPEFKLNVSEVKGKRVAQILAEELPGCTFVHRGAGGYATNEPSKFGERDLLEVKWKEFQFFLRFVPKTQVPKVERVFIKDPLLLKLSFLGLGILGLLLLLLAVGLGTPEPEPLLPPVRVATVEIKELAPPPEPEKKPQIVEEVQKDKSGVKVEEKPKPAAAVAAPQFKAQAPKAPPKMGINSPAPVKDVNSVGLLGALSQGAAKQPGKGVRADMILNGGIQTQAIAGNEGTTVLKNPPGGILGTGKKGGGPQVDRDALARASTTLQGDHSFEPTSVGSIAREGGKAGFQSGTTLEGKDKGAASAGTEFGHLDAGGFQVSGGLDRETVRRAILQYRSQIRNCYERALLSQPKLAGRVVFRWEISATGTVGSNQVTRSDVGSKSLESCVDQVIRGMHFPAATNLRSTTVIYPFVFQSKTE